MTKYTAEDYARAHFARHEDGRIAARWRGGSLAWETSTGFFCSDADMAADPSWSIVRDAESLTPREHLDAAWEKAHEVDVIPVGAACIVRYSAGETYVFPDGYEYDRPAKSGNAEYRLLDPPPAPAWHNARIIEATLKDGRTPRKWARTDIGTWLRLDGDEPGEEYGSAALHDVTVIVGADT